MGGARLRPASVDALEEAIDGSAPSGGRRAG
jgi:hypothetical protein